MKIIQLYLGNQCQGFALWEDTVWDSLITAKSNYPGEVYREIETDSIEPTDVQEKVATAESCELSEFVEGGE